jgi:hypothetical protein
MELSSKGRSVSMEVSFWIREDGAIHLTSNDPDVKTFYVVVRPDPAKPSGHPYLFRELAKCLRQKGAPAPDVPASVG